MNKTVALIATIIFIFISGLAIAILVSTFVHGNDVHDYYKTGIVTEIENDISFGFSFTDWRNDLIFADGTRLWIEHDCDLSKVRFNETGIYHFKTNFFEYDGSKYEFYNLIDVFYLEYEE